MSHAQTGTPPERTAIDFIRLFAPELVGEIEEASLVPLDEEIFTDACRRGDHRHGKASAESVTYLAR